MNEESICALDSENVDTDTIQTGGNQTLNSLEQLPNSPLVQFDNKMDDNIGESIDLEPIPKKSKLSTSESIDESLLEPSISTNNIQILETNPNLQQMKSDKLSNLPNQSTSEIINSTMTEPELDDLIDRELLDDDADEDVDKDDEEEDDEDEDEELLDDEEDILDDVDAESVMSDLISPAFFHEREARKVEDRKLLALLANFDDEQLNRFETFRRATFAKVTVRRLIQSLVSSTVSQNVVIAMAGLTKVFIGELVEQALDYRGKMGDSGPLQPKHIREAYRHLSSEDKCCTEKLENPIF